ncbi:MAG TPA: hypothetical protein VFZ91_08720 [Allosphingosinicella sp.]
MDPDFVLSVGVVLGAGGLWILQRLLGWLRRPRPASAPREAAPEADERRRLREIDELHQRLAVLERIATDPAERTARAIEELR